MERFMKELNKRLKPEKLPVSFLTEKLTAKTDKEYRWEILGKK